METEVRRRSTRRKGISVVVRFGVSFCLTMGVVAGLFLTLRGHHADDALTKLSDRLSKVLRLDQVNWEEVGSSNLSAKVSKDLLWKVSGLSYGQEMLRIDLADLEKKLIAISWLESVQIQKRLPSTLTIHYSTHQARLLGVHKGRMWFVSSKATWVSPVDFGPMESWMDLPVYTGEQTGVFFALPWMDAFEKELQPALLQIHEINLSGTKITAFLEIKYPSQALKVAVIGNVRPAPNDLIRLKRVVQYLIKNNILVSTIDLRPGKKVVVNVGKRP